MRLDTGEGSFCVEGCAADVDEMRRKESGFVSSGAEMSKGELRVETEVGGGTARQGVEEGVWEHKPRLF